MYIHFQISEVSMSFSISMFWYLKKTLHFFVNDNSKQNGNKSPCFSLNLQCLQGMFYINFAHIIQYYPFL